MTLSVIRTVVGAIVGYVVTVIVVITLIMLVWFFLGNEFAFKEGKLEASHGWVASTLIGGFFAAMIGGMTAALIGLDRIWRAVGMLACIILLFGILSAVTQLNAKSRELPKDKEIANLTFYEAGEYGAVPTGTISQFQSWALAERLPAGC